MKKRWNFVEIYNKNETKLTKIPYSFFFFGLQNAWKSQDQQYNGILLIKFIKEYIYIYIYIYIIYIKGIIWKSHCFLNNFSVDQIDVFSELLWVLLVTKKENTTKIIIRHLLFNNFPWLTYTDKVSLINSLTFMFKYSSFVLDQDGWMFT